MVDESETTILSDRRSTLARRGHRDATGYSWSVPSGCISSSDTTDGIDILGRCASPREAGQVRRSWMESLEHRLQKVCVSVFAILATTHGTCGRVHDPNPQRDVEHSRPSVLSPTLLHAGDALQSTALTRIANAVSHEDHKPTSFTRSAGLLQELLNFSFDGGINWWSARQVRSRCRPKRESESREIHQTVLCNSILR